jgi:hypothetical protein
MGFIKNTTFQRGDLLRVRRIAGYYHYGIASSENTVIHFSGMEGDNVLNPNNIKIIETPIDSFLRGDFLEVLTPFKSKFSREEIEKRARNCIGNSKFNGKFYNLTTNNCEHFAKYCYYGKRKSSQVGIVIGSTIVSVVSPLFFHGSAITLLSKSGTQLLKKKFKKKKSNGTL